jgi:hypothetical protein
MWLFPLPALLAFFGFLYVLFMRKKSWQALGIAGLLVAMGLAIYLVRSWRRKDWPFGRGPVPVAAEAAD